VKSLPFSLMPLPLIVVLSPRFRGIARIFLPLFPNLNTELRQADMNTTAEDYLTYVVISSTVNLVILAIASYLVISQILKQENLMIIGFWIAGIFGFMTLMQLSYPKVAISRRGSKIDEKLLFALRNLLIRLKSGITLYESLRGVGHQNFGVVSDEIKRTVNEIESGIPQIEAIERLTFRNPSATFRRIGWQISNSIKAGVSIETNIQSMVDNLMREHLIKIKNYGSQLNPMAMMYMMLTVVVPSLGITFLIILGSFFGFSIPKNIFWGITFFLAIFQFMFMTVVKSRRPIVGI